MIRQCYALDNMNLKENGSHFLGAAHNSRKFFLTLVTTSAIFVNPYISRPVNATSWDVNAGTSWFNRDDLNKYTKTQTQETDPATGTSSAASESTPEITPSQPASSSSSASATSSQAPASSSQASSSASSYIAPAATPSISKHVVARAPTTSSSAPVTQKSEVSTSQAVQVTQAKSTSKKKMTPKADSKYKYLAELTSLTEKSRKAKKLSQGKTILNRLEQILDERDGSSIPDYEAHLMALSAGWLYRNPVMAPLKQQLFNFVNNVWLVSPKETRETIKETFSKRVFSDLFPKNKTKIFTTGDPTSGLPKGFETKTTAKYLATASSIMFVGLLAGAIGFVYHRVSYSRKAKRKVN